MVLDSRQLLTPALGEVLIIQAEPAPTSGKQLPEIFSSIASILKTASALDYQQIYLERDALLVYCPLFRNRTMYVILILHGKNHWLT